MTIIVAVLTCASIGASTVVENVRVEVGDGNVGSDGKIRLGGVSFGVGLPIYGG